MNFIKENWFKVSIIVIAVASLALAYTVLITEPRSNKVNQKNEFSIETVTTNKDGTRTSEQAPPEPPKDTSTKVQEIEQVPKETAFDWRIPIAILPEANNILNTNREAYAAFESMADNEISTQNNISELLRTTTDPIDKQWLLQLFNYSKQTSDSINNLLVWTDTSVNLHERLIAAINTRDKDQYLLTKTLISQNETKKDALLLDYSNKDKIKKDFAATGI